MKKLLSVKRYDVIHSFKEYDCWPFFKAAKEGNIGKRIFHCNVNMAVHRTFKNLLLFTKNKKLSLKYSTSLVGVSDLSCKNAFGNKKYQVLFNTYNEQKYNVNVSNMLSKDELVITHVASYNDNKNQLFSLNVLSELMRLHKNTRLNLVGACEMSPYYQRLIEYVKSNDLGNNMFFVEKTDSVENIYNYTTFTILPSYSEGLPLTIIEAQACGINVFASSNVTEECNCGGAIFLDLAKGPAFWAKEMYRLFMEKGNLRTRYDVSKFSFNRFKKEIEIIYQTE